MGTVKFQSLAILSKFQVLIPEMMSICTSFLIRTKTWSKFGSGDLVNWLTLSTSPSMTFLKQFTFELFLTPPIPVTTNKGRHAPDSQDSLRRIIHYTQVVDFSLLFTGDNVELRHYLARLVHCSHCFSCCPEAFFVLSSKSFIVSISGNFSNSSSPIAQHMSFNFSNTTYFPLLAFSHQT
jgi:hypothetical protein